MKTNKPKQINRRDFVKKSAIGAGGLILAPTILSSGCVKGTNDHLRIGHIGLGDRGSWELKNYFLHLAGSRSVAVCDVYKDRQDSSLELVTNYYKENGISDPGCIPYLYDDEILQRDDIDAVHITSPDHWHVPLAIKAARAGKHIMLAKPLGLSYPNYLILREEMKKNDVRFHYATQQRTSPHMQMAIDMIREGKIGEIERVDVWCPGKNPVESPVCNEVPVPDGFDFDRWTGPGPLKTYCPDRVTNNSSWFQYDFSIGFLAGWGAHPLDVLVWGIKDQVNGVYSITGTGTFWEPGGIYDNISSWDVHYKYESGVEVHFVSADRAGEMMAMRKMESSNGTTFHGTKGWISLGRGSVESNIPEIDKKLNNFPKNDDGWILSEENTMGQYFLDVIHGKRQETCPLDEAIISDTISHMGDIAIRSEHEVTWDPVQGKVVDDEEANALYIREMREPYSP